MSLVFGPSKKGIPRPALNVFFIFFDDFGGLGSLEEDISFGNQHFHVLCQFFFGGCTATLLSEFCVFVFLLVLLECFSILLRSKSYPEISDTKPERLLPPMGRRLT